MGDKTICPLCECLVVFGRGEASRRCPCCCATVTIDVLMGHVYAEPEQGGEVVRRLIDR